MRVNERPSVEGRAAVGEIELAYECFGEETMPPLILVMGLGGQLHYWHEEFRATLAGRGLFVVRFDNRDVGLSTHLTGLADLASLGAGAPAPYGLEEMAADLAGLIVALGFDSAHLAGISLGGMIVQVAAIEHPEKVRSLVSIASTTGDPSVGAARPEALAALFTPPVSATREGLCEHAAELARAIGSPAFELDEPWLRERAGQAFDRSYDPGGVARHAAAASVATDRTESLRQLSLPALVIHGSEDPLVDVSGGIATAAAIPSAELMIVDGLAHDLPREVWPRVADAIARTVNRGERLRA
jgi:pimeloyl-ACP methyl ester carboxylesterase